MSEEELRKAWAAENHEICQILGKALRYPKFSDDPINFPDCDDDQVCVGEHVAVTLAMEAASAIDRLRKRLSEQTAATLESAKTHENAMRAALAPYVDLGDSSCPIEQRVASAVAVLKLKLEAHDEASRS